MRFKQNSIFLFIFSCYTALLIAIMACLLIVTHNNGLLVLTRFFSYMIVILIVVLYTFIIGEKDIVINEEGIRCLKNKREVWRFSWKEIDQLRPVSKLRSRGVEILPKKHPVTIDLQTQQPQPDYSFQLGRSAKKALQIYMVKQIK